MLRNCCRVVRGISPSKDFVDYFLPVKNISVPIRPFGTTSIQLRKVTNLGTLVDTKRMEATEQQGKSLEKVEQSLNNWLKPQILGEGWDNIGLLVGSGKYGKHEKQINGIMLCNDLRPAVLEEAISRKADMIVSYHPPIFVGMKNIAYGNWKERIIARCLAHDISIYSPHTTLDSVIWGINDRVLNGFKIGNNSTSVVKAITPNRFLDNGAAGVVFTASKESITKLFESIPFQSFPDILLSIQVDENLPSAALSVFGKFSVDAIVEHGAGIGLPDLSFTKSEVPTTFGGGRIIELNEPIDLDNAVDMIKTHLGLGYVQLAYGGNPKVRSAAVCVGSGGSLLKPIAGKVDLLITGEMSHHDILDCVSANSSVVLCNHCSSERHYLPDLANILKVVTGVSNVFVSEEDSSPLRLVL